MELHVINIIRFAICSIILIAGIYAMIKIENSLLRRLTAVLAALLILFNEPLGCMIYFGICATIEAVMVLAGIGFILSLFVVIVLSPFIYIILRFKK